MRGHPPVTASDVLECLADECRTDHVGLWQIVSAVQFDLGAADPVQTQTLTMQLVRSLLQDYGIVVGHPAPDGRGFVTWNVSPELAVRRIEAEWSALGHEPDIGDIAWFTSVP